MLRKTISLAGASALVMTLGPVLPPAQAAPAAATAACSIGLGSWDQAWGHNSRVVTATTPPTVSPVLSTPDIYPPPYSVGPGTTFTAVPTTGGRTIRTGKIIGVSGYLTENSYTIGRDGKLVAPAVQRKIGAGWGGRFVEQSQYRPAGSSQPSRTMLYKQDQYGLFSRFTAVGTGWRHTGDVVGLSTMKSFALIGRGPTYDTFLANNRGGGLYTVRIPTSSPLKPVATPVRTSTWQGFSKLIAAPCGREGTLLLGIAGKTGYLYAVGHANGTKTVIKSLGSVPLDGDWDYFRFAPLTDPLNGA